MGKLKPLLQSLNLEPRALGHLHQAPGRTILSLTVAGEDALTYWQRLRDLTPITHYWPVILGEKYEYWMQQRLQNARETPLEILAQARQINPERWLTETLNAELERYGWPDGYMRDEWPIQDVVANTFCSMCDTSTNQPLQTVVIGLVPTQWSWHVPAWLYFGWQNWNPAPAIHVSLLKRWNTLYGVEVVGMCDTSELELLVLRPPQTPEAALALAYEQYAYCGDIVGQHTRGKQAAGSIDALAATLLRAPVWYFWWD